MEFLKEGYIALFLIITLGIILGKVKIFGFSLDISGVLFVSLILGHFGFDIPKDFLQVGVLLFVFTIGMQAGSGFFEAFKKQGRKLILIALIIIGTTGLVSFLINRIVGLDVGLNVGIFTGSLTSTPGLAAAIDVSQSPMASIGYGLAYPIGVIGVILGLNILPKILRIDLKKEEEKYNQSFKEDFPETYKKVFLINNPNITGKKLKDIKIRQITGCIASRIKHNRKVFTPTADSFVFKGDLIKLVGTEENLKKATMLFGKEVNEEIPLSQNYDVKWIWVSNKKIVNKSYKELNLSNYYHVGVVKIKRSGIEIIPQPTSVFKFGDRILIAGVKKNLDKVSKLLGNDMKKLSETDFLPIFLGIFGGILLGKIEIPIFDWFTFKLGNTGGALIIGLILSRLGKTGPIVWNLSGSANLLIRKFGLLIFLATIGTQAGSELVHTIQEFGFNLIWISVTLTLIPIIVGVIIGRYIFKLNFLTLMGVITGTMTSTPGLGVIQSKSNSNAASVAYATVYPIALVLVIIAAQLLVMF